MTGRRAMIPLSVYEQLRGDCGAIVLYGLIEMHTRRDGAQAYPHQETLADILGVSVPTVKRKLKVLVDAGLLVVKERKVKGRFVGNEYALSGITRDTRTGDHNRGSSEPTGDHGRPPPGITGDPLAGANDLLLNRKDEPTLPSVAVPTIPEAVFAAWAEATGRTGRVKFTPARRRLIELRVKEGFTLDTLLAAAQGWRLSPWHAGANPERKVYNSFELVFRDAGKVEMFSELAFGAAPEADPAAVVVADPAMRLIEETRRREGR